MPFESASVILSVSPALDFPCADFRVFATHFPAGLADPCTKPTCSSDPIHVQSTRRAKRGSLVAVKGQTAHAIAAAKAHRNAKCAYVVALCAAAVAVAEDRTVSFRL